MSFYIPSLTVTYINEKHLELFQPSCSEAMGTAKQLNLSLMRTKSSFPFTELTLVNAMKTCLMT